ncbi:MAG: carboxymuconolactone decarboxylase family protein [Planctomycetes bacterium]|nr:carboxymuconolactone decarboxylase family protein [Planctomycetota bacterium]
MSIPKPYVEMKEQQPALVGAYEQFGEACAKAGPLDAKAIALVKLGISIGAGLEGAAHSHTRTALAAGWTAEHLRHAAIIAAPTIGFPAMMRARGWIEDVVAKV